VADAAWPSSITASRTGAAGRGRPRLLSYVGRWGRARRWLPSDVHRVLDIGCAFAYGTAALKGFGRSERWVVGIERDSEHVRQARHRYPWQPLVRGDATALPFADNTADAVVLLDVLEHMEHPKAILVEARRVLRPGGYLVMSVPHRGPLTLLDPLNAYPALQRRWPSWPGLEPADECAGGVHRHFTPNEAQALLGQNFTVDRVARSGTGASEVLHLFMLILFKGLLRWRGAYLMLRGLHFLVYILDDLIPAGPLGYHLALRARAR